MEAQPGPSHEYFASHSQWNEPGLSLTFIGYQVIFLHYTYATIID